MAIRFTDLQNNNLFVFELHEHPETLPWSWESKLNKIKYPDGHVTNQIIGVYRSEIDFGGTFYGTYVDGLKLISAKERADKIQALMYKVIRVEFAVGGFAGDAWTYIIEGFETTIKNYWEVDYKIKLVPHEPQTRVKPSKVSDLSIGSSLLNNIATHAANAATTAAKGAATTAVGKVLKTNIAAPVVSEPVRSGFAAAAGRGIAYIDKALESYKKK